MLAPKLPWIFRAALAAALFTPAGALAQSEGPVDIDFGGGRIGGPGTTRRERAAIAAEYDPDELPTEDNVPKEGDKRRLPHLHILAKRYVQSKMWKDACTKFDQISSEGGMEAVTSAPDGQRYAARSYLECAEIAANAGEAEKTERLLALSEKYGPSDYRHAIVRRGLKVDAYKKKVANGDLDGAISLFDALQAERADEDERIWFGEQIADLADTAYKAGDKEGTQRYLGYGEKVSPQNPRMRELRERIASEGVILQRSIGIGVVGVALIAVFAALGRWRGRKKIEALAGGQLGGGKKNKFIDDE